MTYDCIKTTTTTTGTGNITVSSSAVARCRPLADIPTNTSGVKLRIDDENGTDWELVSCTVLSATTFSRDTVIKGSNGTSKVNFAAGTKTVSHVVTADDYNDFGRISQGVEASGLPLASAPTSADFLTIIQGGVEKRIAIDTIKSYFGIAASAPTAVTMTGSTGGVVNTASGNFSVNTNAARTAAVIVTPTPVAGITFNPTSVTLPVGSAAGTFTATPTTTGAKVIAVTNDSGLTNPASITYTVTASATVPAAPTIGTAVAGDGYIDVYFTRNSDGGSAVLDSTATLSTGQTATGATSPIRVTAPNGTPATATVKDRNAVGLSAASAASNSVTPAVPAQTTQYPRMVDPTGSLAVETGPAPYDYSWIGYGSNISGLYDLGVAAGQDFSLTFETPANGANHMGFGLVSGAKVTVPNEMAYAFQITYTNQGTSGMGYLLSRNPTGVQADVVKSAGLGERQPTSKVRISRTADVLKFEVSTDGGTTYTQLGTYTGVTGAYKFQQQSLLAANNVTATGLV